jgi:hypothetical protein
MICNCEYCKIPIKSEIWCYRCGSAGTAVLPPPRLRYATFEHMATSRLRRSIAAATALRPPLPCLHLISAAAASQAHDVAPELLLIPPNFSRRINVTSYDFALQAMGGSPNRGGASPKARVRQTTSSPHAHGIRIVDS